MFNPKRTFLPALMAALIGCAGLLLQANAVAQQVNDIPNPRQQDAEVIEVDEFINEASAKNLAEIETAKLAIEGASSPEVKDYARQLIEDHKNANQQLKQLAQKKNVELADDPALMDQAKALILEQRDESFDEAYANNQVAAHEQTIELFEQASRSNDPDIKQFADEMLPKLKQHLDKARELADITEQNEGNV